MISDFKAGAKICQSVLLRVQRVGTSSNGAPFARGLAEDNSGKIPFITFEAGIGFAAGYKKIKRYRSGG